MDYAADGNSQSLRALELASSLGYVSVHVTLDPNDWASPTPSQVTERVLKQLSDAESKNGHIILLHDAGGNRRPTIQALPELIDALRRRGFTFVPVYELLGKTRNEVMPPSQTEGYGSVWLANVTGMGFRSLSWLADAVPAIAITASVFGTLRLVLIIFYALGHRRTERDRQGFPVVSGEPDGSRPGLQRRKGRL